MWLGSPPSGPHRASHDGGPKVDTQISHSIDGTQNKQISNAITFVIAK